MRQKRVRTAVIHARVMPELHERLRDLAARERRTLTQMLELLVEEGIDRRDSR